MRRENNDVKSQKSVGKKKSARYRGSRPNGSEHANIGRGECWAEPASAAHCRDESRAAPDCAAHARSVHQWTCEELRRYWQDAAWRCPWCLPRLHVARLRDRAGDLHLRRPTFTATYIYGELVSAFQTCSTTQDITGGPNNLNNSLRKKAERRLQQLFWELIDTGVAGSGSFLGLAGLLPAGQKVVVGGVPTLAQFDQAFSLVVDNEAHPTAIMSN